MIKSNQALLINVTNLLTNYSQYGISGRSSSTRPKSGLAALLQHRSLLANRRLAHLRSRGRKWHERPQQVHALATHALCFYAFSLQTLLNFKLVKMLTSNMAERH